MWMAELNFANLVNLWKSFDRNKKVDGEKMQKNLPAACAVCSVMAATSEFFFIFGLSEPDLPRTATALPRHRCSIGFTWGTSLSDWIPDSMDEPRGNASHMVLPESIGSQKWIHSLALNGGKAIRNRTKKIQKIDLFYAYIYHPIFLPRIIYKTKII